MLEAALMLDGLIAQVSINPKFGKRFKNLLQNNQLIFIKNQLKKNV